MRRGYCHAAMCRLLTHLGVSRAADCPDPPVVSGELCLRRLVAALVLLTVAAATLTVAVRLTSGVALAVPTCPQPVTVAGKTMCTHGADPTAVFSRRGATGDTGPP